MANQPQFSIHAGPTLADLQSAFKARTTVSFKLGDTIGASETPQFLVNYLAREDGNGMNWNVGLSNQGRMFHGFYRTNTHLGLLHLGPHEWFYAEKGHGMLNLSYGPGADSILRSIEGNSKGTRRQICFTVQQNKLMPSTVNFVVDVIEYISENVWKYGATFMSPEHPLKNVRFQGQFNVHSREGFIEIPPNVVR